MIIILFLFFSIFMFLLYKLYINMSYRDMLKERIEKITLPYMRTEENVTESRYYGYLLRYFKFARGILNRLNFFTRDEARDLGKVLSNAGYFSRNALIGYITLQFLAFIGFTILGMIIVVSYPRIANWPILFRGAFVLFMIWLGYRVPKILLNKRIKKYRLKMKRSLLEFMDLFLICIEAGFGNDKALNRVANELAFIHPELCGQAKILITELEILPNRRQAWDNFASRTGLEEVSVISQIIKQSEQLGSSVAAALRTQVEMFRNERLSYVEQKAMRLPTLLTLPLVVFIFPALLLVILGPAIIKGMAVFSQ